MEQPQPYLQEITPDKDYEYYYKIQVYQDDKWITVGLQDTYVNSCHVASFLCTKTREDFIRILTKNNALIE